MDEEPSTQDVCHDTYNTFFNPTYVVFLRGGAVSCRECESELRIFFTFLSQHDDDSSQQQKQKDTPLNSITNIFSRLRVLIVEQRSNDGNRSGDRRQARPSCGIAVPMKGERGCGSCTLLVCGAF
jgi:hypothetical protein